MRECKCCEVSMPLALFDPIIRKNGSPYTNPRCRPCRAVEARRHDQAPGAKRRSLERNYGLSPAAYDALLAAQCSACPVCTAPFGDSKATTPHVDHDHVTGRVRGLLHMQCNVLLGNARDDVATLRRAIVYLEQ